MSAVGIACDIIEPPQIGVTLSGSTRTGVRKDEDTVLGEIKDIAVIHRDRRSHPDAAAGGLPITAAENVQPLDTGAARVEVARLCSAVDSIGAVEDEAKAVNRKLSYCPAVCYDTPATLADDVATSLDVQMGIEVVVPLWEQERGRDSVGGVRPTAESLRVTYKIVEGGDVSRAIGCVVAINTAARYERNHAMVRYNLPPRTIEALDLEGV